MLFPQRALPMWKEGLRDICCMLRSSSIPTVFRLGIAAAGRLRLSLSAISVGEPEVIQAPILAARDFEAY
jgi:hypothetical protein